MLTSDEEIPLIELSSRYQVEELENSGKSRKVLVKKIPLSDSPQRSSRRGTPQKGPEIEKIIVDIPNNNVDKSEKPAEDKAKKRLSNLRLKANDITDMLNIDEEDEVINLSDQEDAGLSKESETKNKSEERNRKSPVKSKTPASPVKSKTPAKEKEQKEANKGTEKMQSPFTASPLRNAVKDSPGGKSSKRKLFSVNREDETLIPESSPPRAALSRGSVTKSARRKLYQIAETPDDEKRRDLFHRPKKDGCLVHRTSNSFPLLDTSASPRASPRVQRCSLEKISKETNSSPSKQTDTSSAHLKSVKRKLYNMDEAESAGRTRGDQTPSAYSTRSKRASQSSHRKKSAMSGSESEEESDNDPALPSSSNRIQRLRRKCTPKTFQLSYSDESNSDISKPFNNRLHHKRGNVESGNESGGKGESRIKVSAKKAGGQVSQNRGNTTEDSDISSDDGSESQKKTLLKVSPKKFEGKTSRERGKSNGKAAEDSDDAKMPQRRGRPRKRVIENSDFSSDDSESRWKTLKVSPKKYEAKTRHGRGMSWSHNRASEGSGSEVSSAFNRVISKRYDIPTRQSTREKKKIDYNVDDGELDAKSSDSSESAADSRSNKHSNQTRNTRRTPKAEMITSKLGSQHISSELSYLLTRSSSEANRRRSTRERREVKYVVNSGNDSDSNVSSGSDFRTQKTSAGSPKATKSKQVSLSVTGHSSRKEKSPEDTGGRSGSRNTFTEKVESPSVGRNIQQLAHKKDLEEHSNSPWRSTRERKKPAKYNFDDDSEPDSRTATKSPGRSKTKPISSSSDEEFLKKLRGTPSSKKLPSNSKSKKPKEDATPLRNKDDNKKLSGKQSRPSRGTVSEDQDTPGKRSLRETKDNEIDSSDEENNTDEYRTKGQNTPNVKQHLKDCAVDNDATPTRQSSRKRRAPARYFEDDEEGSNSSTVASETTLAKRMQHQLLATPLRKLAQKHTHTPLKEAGDSDSDAFVPKVATPKTPKASNLTPSHRKSLARRGLLTPSMPLRDRSVSTPKTPQQEAMCRLHVSAVPKALPCREKEFADIYRFIEGKLLDEAGGCMYISGTPGTGKTATVREVIESLRQAVFKKELPDFQFIEMNAMGLSEPRQAYVYILKALTGEKSSTEQAQRTLEKMFTRSIKRKTNKSIVLMVDELDILWTRREDVVYNLLDWPTKFKSRFIVLTIANTMDMPERMLKGRVTSRLGLTRLTFQPYTFKQLEKIVQSRLEGIKAFDSDAVQLVARKVASVSGDARRALDICRRATELAELDGDDVLVNISHVDVAVKEMLSSSKLQALKACSEVELFFLKAAMTEVERTGIEETRFFKVYKMLGALCVLDGREVPNVSLAMKACNSLGSMRILLTEHSRPDSQQRILLNVNAEDVRYTLKEMGV